MFRLTGREIWFMFALLFAVFGTSWLFSTLLDSPVMAVLAGLVTPYSVATALYVLQLRLGWEIEGVNKFGEAELSDAITALTREDVNN